MIPTDIITYYMDLPAENAAYLLDNTSKPEWKIHHSFRPEYFANTLSPKDMRNAANALFNSDEQARKYETNRIRSGPGELDFAEGPDSATLMDIKYVCMNASESKEKRQCQTESASLYGERPTTGFVYKPVPITSAT